MQDNQMLPSQQPQSNFGNQMWWRQPPEYQGGAAGAIMGFGNNMVGGAMRNVLNTANNYGGMLQGAMGQMGAMNLANQEAALKNRLINALVGSVAPPVRAPNVGVTNMAGSIYGTAPAFAMPTMPGGLSGAQHAGIGGSVGALAGQEGARNALAQRLAAAPAQAQAGTRANIANSGYQADVARMNMQNVAPQQQQQFANYRMIQQLRGQPPMFG